MPSIQEAFKDVGLVSAARFEQVQKERIVDGLISAFEQKNYTDATLVLSLSEIAWRAKPENKGKSREDFISELRELLLK